LGVLGSKTPQARELHKLKRIPSEVALPSDFSETFDGNRADAMTLEASNAGDGARLVRRRF
jgi:hypothetical protein